MRTTAKIFYYMTVIAATIFFAALIAVQTPAVQTRLAEKALQSIENHINGKISVGKVHIDPFKAIVLRDLVVLDADPFRDSLDVVDTLFRARYVTANFSIRSILKGGSISIASAKVTDGLFFLTVEPENRGCAPEADTSGTTNIKRIFKLGGGKDTEPSEKEIFSIGNVELENMSFRMRNFRKDASDFPDGSMNWFDLDVHDINLKGRGLRMKGGIMYGTCDRMSFTEKSGYQCFLLTGDARVGRGKTIVDNIRLIDRWSNIDIPSIKLLYKNTDAWSEFISQVRMEGDISSSTVSLRTLKYFAPALDQFRMSAKIKGKVTGYVNDLKLSDIQFETCDADGFVDWDGHKGRGISGELSGSLIGIPDTRTMLTEAAVKKLSFTSRGLEAFIKGWAPGVKLDIRKICKGERVSFHGKVRGPLNRLKVRGKLNSGFGKVNADADIRNVIDKFRPLTLRGAISTEDLDISRILGDGIPVGKCDMRTGLSAVISADTLGVTIDSLKVDGLDVLGYKYTNIAAAGTFSQSAFDGRIVCSDPNLNFLFQGIFSLSSKTQNALYQFYANLGYADLHALNIDKRKTSRMSLRTQANFTRVSGEDILGNIRIDNMVLEDEHGAHNVGNIEISSHASDDVNRVSLKSKFADGSFVGSRFFNSFIRDLQTATTRRELPSLYRKNEETWTGNSYDVSLRLHDTRDVLSFFAPGVYVADSTALKLGIDRDGKMSASLNSRRIALRDKYLKNIKLRINNADGKLSGDLLADEIMARPALMRKSSVKLIADNDSLRMGISYDNDEELASRGELFLDGMLYRDEDDSLSLKTMFRPSYIYLKSKLWNIASSDIDLHDNHIKVDSLRIVGDNQAINIDGGWSSAEPDTLRVSLDKFDISLTNYFTDNGEMDIQGLLTGRAMVTSSSIRKAGILLNLTCDSTMFGGQRAGKVKVAGVWDEGKQGFNYVCRNLLDGKKTFDAFGNFYPSSRQVEGNISLDGLNAGYAMPFLSSLFSEIDGKISGDIAFSGPYNALDISSKDLRLENTLLKVDFTNVGYITDGPVSLDSNGVKFQNVKVNDRFGKTGTVSGGISWNHFRDMTFDTIIHFNEMEVLNLAEKDNPFFYGGLSATGNLSVTGPLNSILLSADARTAGRGEFHIPTSSSSSSSKSNLLTFKEPYREIFIDPYEAMMERLREKEKQANSLGIRLHINATPDVTASIEIDKDAGNILSGNGNGVIDLDIRPSAGTFSINGNYIITSGTYHFVALGIAKRDFTIQNGSSVRFNGDVMDSDLNINALYKTKASVGTLIADTTSTARRTVECGISITDKIRNPRLGFSINIPDLDPTTMNKVESALNTQDKVQKQLLALLISNSFLPDEQSGITNTSSTMLYSNVSEIMSAQLNNILQKLNIPVDFGLDYQQNASGSDIFDVALSTALFNNRVIVNGTIGNRQYSSNTSGSEVVGDLDIDVKLDKPGALRLNLFSHSADQYTNYLDNSQRNGVGLTYQKEYDSIGEFLRNLFRSKKRKQELEAARQQEIQNERKVRIKIEAQEPKKKRTNGKKK